MKRKNWRYSLGLKIVALGRWVIPMGFGIRYHLREDILQIRQDNSISYNTLDWKLKKQNDSRLPSNSSRN